ncbi:hypothetical protein SAMN05216249_10456 [Acetitomaculum ruminis DSM 5522]|uniref:Phage protein n=1 Tax=Acetitomaculum ruminis DSM 5522 TaxID=1120918 RepID=A0A1I0WFM9_9FIRM|nr:hypothetical protein [Acetitomaculum ruminis]SFA87575.1 hypothetical protein SAMN05216249_10456 [Acetitomaculum ruminis DSM 5522]
MNNDIVNAIARAIRKEYDNTYKIYIESVEQGFKEPCFSIVKVSAKHEHKFFRRRLKEYTFAIYYFPSDKRSTFECAQAEEELFDLLEEIETSDMILRSYDFDAVITDGVLCVTAKYDALILKDVKTEEIMEVAESEIAPKEGDSEDG